MGVFSYIMSSIIIITTPLIFSKVLLNPKLRADKSKIVVAILVALISSILIYMYIDGILRTMLSLVLYIILIHSIYDISIKRTSILMIGYIIILIITELLMLLIINNFDFIRHNFYMLLTGCLTSDASISIVTILLTILLTKIFKNVTKIKIKNESKIVIFSALALISILIFFFKIIENFKEYNEITFYLVTIFAFVSGLIIVVYEENKNVKLEDKYNELLELMQMYEMRIENERIVRHEYKNQLITVKSKIIDKEDINKIISYINEIQKDETEFEQEEYSEYQHLSFNSLKYLIHLKTELAKSKKINVTMNISKTIEESKLKELTAKEFRKLEMLISIYLDNAIEVSEASEKKQIIIKICACENIVKFVISNTYSEKVDINKLEKKSYSIKGKGYGLEIANKITKLDKTFSEEKQITKKLYIQTLMIKK